MYVHVGNDHAIEGYRDPTSEDPELVRFRPLDGERITEIVFPEGTGLQEAFATTLAALEHHLAEGAKPAWVQSDSQGLQDLLVEHFGLTPSKATSRPKTWGQDTGADQVTAPTERSEA